MKKLLVVVLLLCIVSSASAVGAWWNNDTSNRRWRDSGNWDDGAGGPYPAPISGQAYIRGGIQGPIIEAGDFISVNLIASGAGTSTVDIQGGQLNLTGYWFGEGGSTVIMTVSGGALLVDGMWGNALEIGNYAGSISTLNVSSGTVTANTGTLRIGMNGGSGYVNISGSGAFDVPDIKVDAGFNLDIAGDGVLYLAGNKLEYFNTPGNGDARLYGAIMSGVMTANGTAGYTLNDFMYWYDTASDRTVIRVPEPATIALLGLGGLALIRRKR